jgi:hypothetical protein
MTTDNMIPEPRETSVPERNNDNGATMSKHVQAR